jgi:hypothetical protein
MNEYKLINQKQSSMKYRWYYKIPFFVTLGVLAMIGLGYLVMFLWNLLIPELFNGPVLTFWQAVGLFVLTKILLHSSGFNRHHGLFWNRGRYHYWKTRMEEKMASMTPEEKEKFTQEWGRHCRPGYWQHENGKSHPAP